MILRLSKIRRRFQRRRFTPWIPPEYLRPGRDEWLVALNEAEIATTTRSVARTIASFMGEDGAVWVLPLAHIARGAGISRTTARRHIKLLSEAGYLHVSYWGSESGYEHDGRANDYTAELPVALRATG